MKKQLLAGLAALVFIACTPEPQPIAAEPVAPRVDTSKPVVDSQLIASVDSGKKEVPIPPPVLPVPPDPGPYPEPWCEECPGPDVTPPPDVIFDMDTAALEEPVYDWCEEPPHFPGGDSAMRAFLAQNIRYPVAYRESSISGTIYIKFVVEKDGSLSTITVLKEVAGAPDLTKEAIRVIKLMPAWIPGKDKGKVVRSKWILPVKFVLQ